MTATLDVKTRRLSKWAWPGNANEWFYANWQHLKIEKTARIEYHIRWPAFRLVRLMEVTAN